jgi:6-phosphogluconolactonase
MRHKIRNFSLILLGLFLIPALVSHSQAYYNLGAFLRPMHEYYVYQASIGGSCIQAYSLNHQTGGLQAVGSCVTGPTTPKGLVAHPNNRWLYVADSSANNAILLYSINQGNGTLTYVASYSPGGTPAFLVLTPDGKYLYASVENQTVAGFTINQTTGALTAVSGSPTTATGTAYYGIAVDPSETHLYVSDDTTPAAVHVFPISSTTGAISAPTNYTTSPSQTGAYGISVSQDGNYVYMGAQGSANIVYWSNSSGTLSGQTQIATGATTPAPWGTLFSASGSVFYANLYGSNEVGAYTYNSSTGGLTAVTGSPFSTGSSTGPKMLALDPDKAFLFVSLYSSGQLAEFTIDQTTGALSSLTTIASGGATPTNIAVVKLH